MRNKPIASLLILCGSSAAFAQMAATSQNRPDANNTSFNNAPMVNESTAPDTGKSAVQNTLANTGDDQPPKH